MTIGSSTLARLLLMALFAMVPLGLQSSERRPLPYFVVTDTTTGQSVESTSIVLQRNWLLLLVKPNCAPCDRLLAALPRDVPSWPSRFVVVVQGGDQVAAAAYKARFPDLAGSRWYADEYEASFVVSSWSSNAPIMFGLRNDRLEWSLTGIAPDVETVRSAMKTWLRFEE